MEDLVYDAEFEVYVAATPAGAEIVSFANEEQSLFRSATPLRSITVRADGSSRSMVCWGENNLEPQERELLILENNIVPSLLRKRRNLILGAGAILYNERFEWDDAEGRYRRIVEELEMPEAMRSWLEENDYQAILRRAASELIKHNNIFAEYLEKGSGEVASVKVHESLYVRAEKSEKLPGKPKVLNWLLSGDWSLSRQEVTSVPNHDPADKRQTKYIRRMSDEMFGGPYYYAASWWGSRIWVKLANCIPLFHLHNLKNGYLIRYHVKVPKDYFLRLPEGKSLHSLTKTEKEEVYASTEQRKRMFQEQLNEILVGVKNAGRTLFTTYDVQAAVGGQFPGVIIESVPVELKDESLLKLFDKSNDANISALGMLPSISGVQTQGKLSSGSDIRNALAFYLATDVQEERRIVFEVLNYALRKNGWLSGELRNARLGARDVVIVTTDKNPTGMEDASPSQSSDNGATVQD